tara:strand:+ start:1330 stop:1749 length:420 start_codon:yes stop_codon:yes gene_type:complete
MKKTFTFICPLSIKLYKKNYALNLNTYRNLHFNVNNNLKTKFKQYMQDQIEQCPEFDKPVSIRFKITKDYRKSPQIMDKSNVYSVVTKYLYDAITEAGKWEDDNDNFIKLEQIMPTNYRENKKGDLESFIKITITELEE